MKTYTITQSGVEVSETINEGSNVWNLDAAAALKMLDMFQDMPQEVLQQLEQMAGASQAPKE